MRSPQDILKRLAENKDKAATPNNSCQMVETKDGWVCKTHG